MHNRTRTNRTKISTPSNFAQQLCMLQIRFYKSKSARFGIVSFCWGILIRIPLRDIHPSTEKSMFAMGKSLLCQISGTNCFATLIVLASPWTDEVKRRKLAAMKGAEITNCLKRIENHRNCLYQKAIQHLALVLSFLRRRKSASGLLEREHCDQKSIKAVTVQSRGFFSKKAGNSTRVLGLFRKIFKTWSTIGKQL